MYVLIIFLNVIYFSFFYVLFDTCLSSLLLKHSTKSTCYFYSNFYSEILYNDLLNIIKEEIILDTTLAILKRIVYRNGVKNFFS